MTEPAPNLAHWLPAARAGSPEALGQVLEACRAYLLVVAQRELDPALHAKGGASDLVQETFLEAQRDFPQFRGDSEAELLGWLRRMLLNNLASFTRQYRATDKRSIDREVKLAPDPSSSQWDGGVRADSPSPSEQAVDQEQAQALAHAVERLPEDYRQIVTLRYYEERSFDEIAQRMQRSPNAVRKLWARAVERLQQELEPPS
jgi:RNA polymerase sigma-70 factor (ECF subfamily)